MKEDIQLRLDEVKLDTVLIRNEMYKLIKDKKLSETVSDKFDWYLDRIDDKINRIKELAEQ